MQSQSFHSWLVSFLTDPSVTQAIGSFVALLLIAIATCFKFYKEEIKAYCKKRFQVFMRQEHRLDSNYSTNAAHINQKLQLLREKVDCSRICVLQFRDGSSFTLSNPMFRIYCSYEVLRNGIKSCARSFSDILGTTVISFIGPILDTRVKPSGTSIVQLCPRNKCPKTHIPPRIVKIDTEAMQFDTARNILEENGVHSVYAMPLYAGNSPIGILMLHYIVGTDREAVLAEHICEICETAHYVQQMLDRNIKSPN